MKNFQKAIREWKVALSAKQVILDPVILSRESEATFHTTQKILAILKPTDTRQVSGVVKIAARNKIPVYPISGGKNWGLGSKVPQGDGVIIDLSNMKKIRSFDEKLAYITVEPGVTFKAAEDFLIRKNSSLMLDTVGSTPDASIIGNTAERGHGMALYADRFNFVCGLEVVLPNGEVIETGFTNIKDTALGPLAKWGVGPYIDGLFTQSNLGIITRLTLWLRAKPSFFQSFIFLVDDEKKLALAMEEWRQMGLQGFQSSLRVFNDMRMISFLERFPENEDKPLRESARKSLRKKLKIGKWIGLGGLYAPSQQHANADKELITKRIGHLVDSISFFDQASVDQQYKDADQGTRNYLDFMFNKTLLRGFTSATGINMTYWRKPKAVPVGDLHRDQCGVLWYCPAIPFTGKDTLRAIRLCTKISKSYGFELNLGFLFISQRTLDITGAICYDRAVKGEDKRAKACHDALMKAMTDEGYSPYRLGIQSMELMKRLQKKSGAELIQRLKNAIDPDGIMAPGHYISTKKA
jgi:4-cresol dehydrogenase (hydroxylating)